VPQSMAKLHASDTYPQLAPSCAHVLDMQVPVPHLLGPPPPPQFSPDLQVPHDTIPPQPSGADPHVAPSCAQVLGLHPHWLAVPLPPHEVGGAHIPQSIASLQVSDT
jgi:hypothetical protein